MTTKYLRVNIAYDPNWKQHTDRITKKVNNTVGFLKRNLKSSEKNIKINTYIAVVILIMCRILQHCLQSVYCQWTKED